MALTDVPGGGETLVAVAGGATALCQPLHCTAWCQPYQPVSRTRRYRFAPEPHSVEVCQYGSVAVWQCGRLGYYTVWQCGTLGYYTVWQCGTLG